MTQTQSIDAVVDSCIDEEGREALRRGHELMGKQHDDDNEIYKLLERASESEELGVSVWGYTLHAYYRSYNPHLADKALERMGGWSIYPDAYALAYFVKAKRLIEPILSPPKIKELLEAKDFLLNAIINNPDNMVFYQHYCQAAAATRTNIRRNDGLNMFGAIYRQVKGPISQETVKLFEEHIFKKNIRDKKKLYKALEKIDSCIAEMCLDSYLGIIKPFPGSRYDTITLERIKVNPLKKRKLDKLNTLALEIMNDEHRERRHFRYDVFFIGSREYIGKSAEAYDGRIQGRAINLNLRDIQRKKQEYHVMLNFKNDQETWGMGVGKTYEKARNQAEKNFPFELSDKIQEKVAVHVIYRLPQQLINMLAWSKKEEVIKVVQE